MSEGGETTGASSREQELTAELDQLRDKTAKWKHAVKEKLDEAARKNEILRSEAQALRDGMDRQIATVRLELNAEFTERTQMKDARIIELESNIKTLQNDFTSIQDGTEKALAAKAQQHAEDKKQVEQRLRREFDTQMEQIMTKQESALERERRKVDQLNSDIAGLQQKLQAAEADLAKTTSATSPDGADALKRQIEQHAQTVAQLKSKLAQEIEKNEQGIASLLEKTQAQHLAEVNRREEQIHVLQTMLRGAQEEIQSASQKQAQRDASNQIQLQSVQRKISAVTLELANKVEQLNVSVTERNKLEENVAQQRRRIEELLQESEARERVFNDMFHEANDRLERVAAESELDQLRQLTEELRERCSRADGERQQIVSRAESAQQNVTRQIEALDDRERAVQKREEKLRQTERRVAENQQALAIQAQNLEKQLASGADPLSNANTDGASTLRIVNTNPLYEGLVTGRMYLENSLSPYIPVRKVGRWLPFVVVVLPLLLLMFWFGGSASTTGQGDAERRVMGLSEELTTVRTQFQSALKDLHKCQEAANTKR